MNTFSKRAAILLCGAALYSVGIAGAASADNEREGVKASAPMACDESLKTALSENAETEVLLVKLIREGDAVPMGGMPTATAVPAASHDLCLVKLLVGPGNPGPADAPSTSKGIGIQLLLPGAGDWNERLRVYGNGGWSGTTETKVDEVAGSPFHVEAANAGYVVATSDNGHIAKANEGQPVDDGMPTAQLDPSFAWNPDGTRNLVGLSDWAERSLHVLAVTTKHVAKTFYGRPHRYAYFDGFSTGGRQGLKIAQVFPEDFDGILSGAPAINWTRYHTGNLFPQVAMMRDLGAPIEVPKLAAVTQASIASCGGELGFLVDPLACQYDPTADAKALCSGVAGSDGVVGTNMAPTCLTSEEARVVNKTWYGQTADGSVPKPSTDNGGVSRLGGERIWFGFPRGTDLTTSAAAGGGGLMLAADQVALEMGDMALGSKRLVNASGNGRDAWKERIGYADLVHAQLNGLVLQPEFSAINTDRTDLTAFSEAGGKILMYHGLGDQLIPVQGSINYYERVLTWMGGSEAVQKFYRLYLVAGGIHSELLSDDPTVPVPQVAGGRDELFSALQEWVERDTAPERIDVTSADGQVSLPICVYPQRIAYDGQGSRKQAAGYSCK